MQCVLNSPSHNNSVLLTVCAVLGFLPGLLHAWYIIVITPDPTYEQVEDEERGHVTHYHIHGQPQYAPGGGRPQQGYGTVSNAPNAQFPGQQNGFVQPPPQAGSSDQAPPSYTQAIQGDNKVQGP